MCSLDIAIFSQTTPYGMVRMTTRPKYENASVQSCSLGLAPYALEHETSSASGERASPSVGRPVDRLLSLDNRQPRNPAP